MPNLSRSAHTAVTTTKWVPVSQVYVANGGVRGSAGRGIESFSPTPRCVLRKASVSSYSMGIIAREVRSCGVASCTCAITTSRSGSDFQTHTSTRPAARFMRKGAAWLMLQASNPLPSRSVRPIARFACVSSIRMAAFRWRRPVKPSESVTGTQSIGSASACNRGMHPAYGGLPIPGAAHPSGTVETARAPPRRARAPAAQTGHPTP